MYTIQGQSLGSLVFGMNPDILVADVCMVFDYFNFKNTPFIEQFIVRHPLE